MRHIILGAGPAGVIAAETIRKHAPNDEIYLVGDEPEAPYSRMAIPYLLIGNIAEGGTHLRHAGDHYARLRIELKRNRAVKLDTAAKTVNMDDGSTHAYDRLLIATGSSPATPPIPGIAGPGVHACWTLADARAIAALAKPGARVLQMGAGFIGCIIMEALANRGVKLSVVEMGDRMVPRMMGPVAGGMIKAWCEKKGVSVHTGAKVVEIGRDATPVMKVKLSTGEVIEADLVISATGVKPNIGFLQDSGVKCLQGVLTDEHLQTSACDVYAAGDCAEAWDKVSGKAIVSAIQPNAADQARVAALNMVGQKAELRGVTQINVLDTLGLISASFGNWEGEPGGDSVELTDHDGWRHLSLKFGDDTLVGCNAIGWTEHVGVMRGLVEGAVRLGPWKARLMADPTLLMEAYLDRAQAQGSHAHVKAA
ncbi:NAD(P)/FAD-dependent oxidoreductase [Rubrivivax albus]|uniref:NAD(P)/FAD-dependent oxidoreductase n=1 Tax=Rubrivivax albus TaxID=2499835 RepID=A0A437JS68_9BURK|nr:FAD-dependent oxidoreductase [Rubrivivax albus]RVT49790.1 NAD(P)/FAD-dependent oxidoreductase [Rubrivivax albus]